MPPLTTAGPHCSFWFKRRRFHIQGVSESEHIFNIIATYGIFYEIELLNYINRIHRRRKRLPRTGSTALDVGANIGNHSIFLNTFVTERVVAFEPNPLVFPVLRQNLRQNCNHFQIHAIALGSRKGKGKAISRSNKNSGMTSIEYCDNFGDIKIKTLDEMNDIYKWNISILKIDVEGMELDVIIGACKTIQRYHPDIYVEISNNEAFERIDPFLARLGYRYMSHMAATPVYHYSHNPTKGQKCIAGVHRLLWKAMSLTHSHKTSSRAAGDDITC